MISLNSIELATSRLSGVIRALAGVPWDGDTELNDLTVNP